MKKTDLEKLILSDNLNILKHKEESKISYQILRIKIFIYSKLLKLDCATCVSDSKLKRFVIRKLLNPVGYYFRKKNFQLKMKL
jgi:hypothetical protein